MLTVTRIYDIIIIQKEKGNLKGGQRKNEKISFHGKRTQISCAVDHCQISTVRYRMCANGASNGVCSSYVCYCVWFAINEEMGGKKW